MSAPTRRASAARFTRSARAAAVLALGLTLAACGSVAHSSSSTTTISSSSSSSPTSALSSSTTTNEPAQTIAAEPVVDLICGTVEAGYGQYPVEIALNGTPDYASLWSRHYDCDAGMADDTATRTMTTVIMPLQKAVVAAAKTAGYDGTDEEILYDVYQYCGSNRPDDPYMTMTDYSDSQVAELKAWMVLCPTTRKPKNGGRALRPPQRPGRLKRMALASTTAPTKSRLR